MSDFETVYNAVASWCIARLTPTGQSYTLEQYHASQAEIVAAHGWDLDTYHRACYTYHRQRVGLGRRREVPRG
jgi:hypothetical protein